MSTETKSTAALEIPAVILIATADQKIQRSLAGFQLEGHRLHWVPTKRALLDAALQYAPDVFLIDEDLPDGNGFELCKALKAEKQARYAPVIMLVSNRRTRMFADAFAHGANDVLVRPTTRDIFAVRIRAALKYGGAVRSLHAIQDNLEARIRRRTDDLSSANEKLRHEVEERRKLQHQLLEQTAALSNAVEGIARLDSKGTFQQVNNAYANHVGLEPERVVGTRWMQTIAPEDRERAQRAYALMRDTGRSELDEVSCITPSPPLYQRMTLVSLRSPEGGLLGFFCFAKDVTQEVLAHRALKQKEHELQQAQKLEAIGRLCGGVAHDFNNYLTAIAGFAELARNSPDIPKRCQEYVSKVLISAERAKGLTRQLLTFSSRRVAVPEVIEINAVIRGLEDVLQRTVGENIVVQDRLSTLPCWIRIDRSQLEQILLNLFVNARDAMPEGGILKLETETGLPAESRREHPVQVPEPEKETWVRLQVDDTGCGMDAHTLKHIFEPFFSTKGQDRNSGLGLATTYGIVQQHGGRVEVQSKPGQGTRFTLYFRKVAAPMLSAQDSPSAGLAPCGTETILVVEDHPDVLGAISGILRAQGYRTLEAPCAEEALEVFHHSGQGIDLLLTDIVMPAMNGIVLSERLRSVRPELKVVYLSGYSEEQALLENLQEGQSLFLQKPCAHDILLAHIRTLLDSVSGQKNVASIPVGSH